MGIGDRIRVKKKTNYVSKVIFFITIIFNPITLNYYPILTFLVVITSIFFNKIFLFGLLNAPMALLLQRVT